VSVLAQTSSIGFDNVVLGVNQMSFGLYLVGFVILIAGLVYGASIMHVAAHWIAVGAIVLLGLAILTGVKATRQKDPSGS
jgi:hypothetical protein